MYVNLRPVRCPEEGERIVVFTVDEEGNVRGWDGLEIEASMGHHTTEKPVWERDAEIARLQTELEQAKFELQKARVGIEGLKVLTTKTTKATRTLLLSVSATALQPELEQEREAHAATKAELKDSRDDFDEIAHLMEQDES